MPIRNPHEETARAGGRPSYGAGHSSFDRPGGGGGQQSQGNRARHANEFAGISATMQAENERRAKQEKENARLAAKAQAERLEADRQQRQKSGNVYKPYTTSREDQFLSAFGGLNYDWADPDSSRSDFLTKDIWGNPIAGGPDQRLWDPFQGPDRKLNWDEINTMLNWGEFDAGPIGNYSGWPGGGGGGYGGWGSWGGSGGYGGGGGGGGGYYESPSGMPRGNPNEAWGAQNPLQQMMISMHGGKGFQQGYDRGGIVGLVR